MKYLKINLEILWASDEFPDEETIEDTLLETLTALEKHSIQATMEWKIQPTTEEELEAEVEEVLDAHEHTSAVQ